MRQRQTVTKKKALTYRFADQVGKSRILDEFVELKGSTTTMRGGVAGTR